MEEEAGERKRKRSRDRFFPHPDPAAAAVTGSASLCHISLRRSSQRLAGGVWPGSLSRRESWAEASARRSPGALPAERPRTSLAGIAGGESGSRWGVGLPAPLLVLRCPPPPPPILAPQGGGGGDPGPLQLSAGSGRGEASQGQRTGGEEGGEERG